MQLCACKRKALARAFAEEARPEAAAALPAAAAAWQTCSSLPEYIDALGALLGDSGPPMPPSGLPPPFISLHAVLESLPKASRRSFVAFSGARGTRLRADVRDLVAAGSDPTE